MSDFVLTREQVIEKAEALFGKDRQKWTFRCPSCKRPQSAELVRAQMKSGMPSQRYGMLKKGDRLNLETACYKPDCNWVANGLFTSGILMVHDPDQDYDVNLKRNCCFIFPLEGDKEMMDSAFGIESW